MDKKKSYKNSPIGYVIPQMPDNDVGLRSFEKKFKGSEFVSPLFGFNVKDTLESPKSYADNNVRTDYEPFRGEKQISDAELLAKYGTIYPEYAGVESHDNPVQKREEYKEVVKEENNFNFNINNNTSYQTPSNNYQEPVNNNYQEPKSYQEPVRETPQSSFNNLNFAQPKEDYSSKDTQLPPFLAQSRTEVKENNYQEQNSYQETNSYQEQNNYQEQSSYQEQNNYQQQNNNYEQRTPEVKVELKTVVKKTYKLPPLSLFSTPDRSKEENTDFLESNKEIINNTLKQFNIDGSVTALTHGPTVSRYEISLAPGINVKKVTSISDNMRMHLSARTLRIQAPIPGKSTIGIEVPNRKAQFVHFIDLVKDKAFLENKNPLRFILGKNIDNETIYQDINKMPHGLIAGMTGSGKSVCVNTLLVSLLLKNTPEDLRLILVDPKFVELSAYNNIPHLLTPVINDAKMASKALKWCVDEMQRRYLVMQESNARNLEEYNERCQSRGLEKMSYILIIIDELADLMSNCASEVEESIQRLTQKARAAGMHLIVATQRPSTDVVKGTIKNNIPTRIAFRVSSAVDSMTILDQAGADNLLGHGDMLVREADGIERVQGAFLKTDDILAVTDYIKEHNEVDYVFTHDHLKTADVKSTSNDNDETELLHAAALFFAQTQSCSINGLQKQFGLGFNRSQKVVKQLEQLGVVGVGNSTSSRGVLLSEDQINDLFNQ